jgi:pimeloyl-ACP methyl ester carboxylesterase
VICVPGMGDLRGEYRFLMDQLAAAGFRAAAMDVRGHGESSTRWVDFSVAGVGSDILALIRHLDGGPAVVIGTSMAAGAAVWAAAEAPELVRALVLIGPFVRGGGDLMGRLLAGLLFTRPWGPGMWAKYYHSLYPTRQPADFAAYSAAIKANLAEPGRLEALQAMLRASKSASETRLPQVKAPALVLMGSKDPDFKPPEAEAQWVAERISGTVRMVEGAGHYPHAEMPEITAPLIVDFLKTQQPEAVTYAG